ncbi:hypothetical protein [Roseospira goensis]|uniref:Uncharacterized protein n=1 Tax=Roseospira goensis TaxID=391922 RepID=A0A7W6WLP0_9PROT|nr:hypothetical protein [Roseospira goensis]MBB4286607.1 hypothetical protein [Roseospira goensis]
MLSRRTLAATLPAAGLVTALPVPAIAQRPVRRPSPSLTAGFFWRCLSDVEGLSDDARRDLAWSIAHDLAARPVPVEAMVRLCRRGPLPAAAFWEEHAALSSGSVVPVFDLTLTTGDVTREEEKRTYSVQSRYFAALWASGADPAVCAVECLKRGFHETDATFGLATHLTLEPAEYADTLRTVRWREA